MDSKGQSVVRRLLDRMVRPYLEERRLNFQGLDQKIDRLHGDLGRLHRELEEVRGRTREIDTNARRAAEISRHTYDREVENRQRLHALRRSEEYELAFSEEEPLVSFLIPTYTSYETLRDVALPSILGQSYSNLEVIVIGDAAPPETAAAIEAVGDPRVRYFNRTYRGPYPEDRSRRWYVIGTPPYNEALALAQGRWIGGLGDDDAVRPDHTERLLAAAREHRYEHCYGKQLVNFVEGEPMTLGKFPPELGEWGLQAAIFHAGLRFIESELSDAIYEEPNDWSMCRRMTRAGVRTGMIDEVVVDKFETRRSSSEAWKEGPIPQVD
ncbi:MAG TPA: glycosyltransferase family 2 protein [Solirubrobacterales bacterium]